MLSILLLELSSYLVFKYKDIEPSLRKPYEYMELSGLYDDKEKLKEMTDEGKKIKSVYDPYRGWKVAPNFIGDYFNTDQYGRRSSGVLHDSIEHVNIGFFGGSTAFGAGAENDTSTISGILQSLLNRKCNKNSYNVINMGVGGSNQTQSIIWLIESLSFQDYDYVIFYDFVNESLHGYRETYQTTLSQDEFPIRFLYHQNYITPESQNNRLSDNIKSYLRRLYSFQIFRLIKHNLFDKRTINEDTKTNNPDSAIVNKVIANYSENMDVINAIGSGYGFHSAFFIQPTLFTKRTLSDFELTIPHLNDKEYIEFEKMIYKAAKQKLRTLENFYDITGVFDSIDHTIYIDDHHISDKGNRIVAKSIYDLLKRNLVGEIICN